MPKADKRPSFKPYGAGADRHMTHRTKGEAAFSHALVHRFWNECKKGRCPKDWPRWRIRQEHAFLVNELRRYGVQHHSPLR